MFPQGRVFTVSQVSGLIQSCLNKEPLLRSLWLRGEITNFKRHSSGHLYFSIKDKEAVIRAVMFRGNADKLSFRPADGQDCFFRGYVSLYPRETQLQFYVEEISPAGVGEEALALEELKRRLAEKGYFNPAAKRKIPPLPRAVGVISSPTGAVIQDIRKVTWRRYPGMPIILYPAAVQGREAVDTLVAGLEAMAGAPVDVVILARGGGSAEDLAAFNTEAVAEAIYRLEKPLISAVGHETDVTIADLVADLRAATPSMAAELAVPIKEELLRGLADLKLRLGTALCHGVERREEKLRLLKNSIVFTQPQRFLDNQREQLSRLEERMSSGTQLALKDKRRLLEREAARLEALSPLATLTRGYAVCQTLEGRLLTDAARVLEGDVVNVKLARGELACKVTERSL
ncbi:MAG: exodeoxyribonuclease VII large subunit [Peptococcaceae bacterium]|nr:exodeoxyribonuclease VII large subunit [Peptococcaceae bacterium]